MKIFVSFVGAFWALARNEVSADDLMNGLFCFGCTREHAFHPPIDEFACLTDMTDPERKKVHGRLVCALEAAERDGRCEWSLKEDHIQIKSLDDLASRNGIFAIISHHMGKDGTLIPYQRRELLGQFLATMIRQEGVGIFQCVSQGESSS